MLLIAVDNYQDLFLIQNVLSESLVQHVVNTSWMDLEYTAQPAQERWPRRLIKKHQLPWLDQWVDEFQNLWPHLETGLGVRLEPYRDTAFWVDEPGFTCDIHTDGEMPGSLHLNWIGSENLATSFYHSKLPEHLRFRQNFKANCGYVMINQSDRVGYRHLQWHGMLEPVPPNSYRLTSYTWLVPVK